MSSLETFIAQSVEENLNLDYKDIRASDSPERLAQTVCAFSNSEGGLLILGVEELREKDEKGNDVKIRPGKITWGPKSLKKAAVVSALACLSRGSRPMLRLWKSEYNLMGPEPRIRYRDAEEGRAKWRDSLS